MSSKTSFDGDSPASPDCEIDEKSSGSFVTPDGANEKSGEWVKEPGENDVLCGRGGSINSHPGNERFRTLVEKRKRVYLTARFKREKRLIASSIVSEIRNLKPPGRFLSRDGKMNMWRDIGDEKARDKTSQALRENAPTIRAEIETEINEQRAEMQRAEEQEAARVTVPPHTPSHAYYNQSWGYPSYYGYAAPPPPPPHHHHHHHPPPPPGYHSPYESQWGGHHHPPPPPPPHGYPSHSPYPQPHPPTVKSTAETAAAFIASGAESIRSWTRSGFTEPTPHHHHHAAAAHHYSGESVHSSSKPIVYVHEDESKKRRMVKFRDDSKYGGRRKRTARLRYSPVQGTSNSLVDSMAGAADEEEDNVEPEQLDAQVDEQNSSLMTQVANQILGSLGSWDTSTIICGFENADDKVPFPDSKPQARRDVPQQEVAYEEDMAVEWEEGQEVCLVDKSANEREEANRRMPPPVVRPRPVPDQASSVGFSSLGSCHSWLPDQLGSAASSFFSYPRTPQAQSGGISPTGSVDMDAVAGMDFSAGGSLGGASLTRVFEHETVDSGGSGGGLPSPSPRGGLSQMGSWDRSVRSRSPLSIGSANDDGSMMSKTSKTSSKASESRLSASYGAPTTDDPSRMQDEDMEWETGDKA